MKAPLCLPEDLLPTHGHFGCGPTAIRKKAVAKLATSPRLGTSHRQAPVRDLVRAVREGIRELLNVPDGWEVVLGNGGASAVWAINAACLIDKRASCGVYGAFTRKCAEEIDRAPHLEKSLRHATVAGGLALPVADPEADAYCWAHNETSTGVRADVTRIRDAREDALMLVDATSIAGAQAVDLREVDCYYFSGQKAFAADGGLWLAIVSPAAQERAGRLSAQSDRWVPAILDLPQALAYSRMNATLNTPAIATLELLADQIAWMGELGGIDAVEARCTESSSRLYAWASAHPLARPFVATPALRSPVVVTLEFAPAVDTKLLIGALRDNGIVDVGPYRGVGDNQLRIGCFPVIDPDDIDALTACLDYLIERIAA